MVGLTTQYPHTRIHIRGAKYFQSHEEEHEGSMLGGVFSRFQTSHFSFLWKFSQTPKPPLLWRQQDTTSTIGVKMHVNQGGGTCPRQLTPHMGREGKGKGGGAASLLDLEPREHTCSSFQHCRGVSMRVCNTISPLVCGFAFHSFSYLWSTAVQKYWLENTEKKIPKFEIIFFWTVQSMAINFHFIIICCCASLRVPSP